MVNNRNGRKLIGATLSMAMAVTAVPAMTSLACENAPQGYGAPESVSVDPRTSAVQNLHDLLDKMLDLGNDHSEVLDAVLDFHTYCTFVNYGVDVYYSDDLYSTQDIINITDILNSIYEEALDALNSTSEPAEAREEALRNLYNILDTMLDFGISHAHELNAVIDFQNYCGWINHGDDVYYHNRDISTQEIIELTNTLNGIYNAAVEALRASDNISLPDIVIDNDDDNGFTAIVVDDEENNTEEEIAPDYGMDLDEDIAEETSSLETQTPVDKAPAIEEEIIENETPAEETVATADETPATTSVPSAPATRVAGATRNLVNNRNAIAQQVVNNLYANALNRTADMAGTTYWVNVIIANNGRVDTAITGLLNSAEFNARNLNDDEFVALLYRVILNRAPSVSEATEWTTALANGATRSEVIDAFADSAEFDPTCEAHAI